MENIIDFDPSYLLNKVFIVKRRDRKKQIPKQDGDTLVTTLEIAKSVEQLVANDEEKHDIQSIEQNHMPVIYHRDKESIFVVLGS